MNYKQELLPLGDLVKHNDYIKILQFKKQMNIHQQKIFDAVLSSVQEMKRIGKVEKIIEEGDLIIDFPLFKKYLMKGARISKINRQDLVNAMDEMTSIKHSWNLNDSIGSFVIFQRAEIDFKTNKLYITFGKNFRTENLLPASNFTYFAYEYLNKFKSQYSRVLYQYLKMLIGKDSSKPFRTQITLEIDYIRAILGVNPIEHKEYYSNGSSFVKRCIDPAVKEMNVYSDIFVSYNLIKVNKSIKQIDFSFNFRNDIVITPIEEVIIEDNDTSNIFDIKDFKEFKNFVIEKYKGSNICNNVIGFDPETIIGMTHAGFLKNSLSNDILSKEVSFKVWNYLFNNQFKLGVIEEITDYIRAKRLINNLINIGNDNIYKLVNVVEDEINMFKLHLQDINDQAKPIGITKESFSLEDIKKRIFNDKEI